MKRIKHMFVVASVAILLVACNGSPAPGEAKLPQPVASSQSYQALPLSSASIAGIRSNYTIVKTDTGYIITDVTGVTAPKTIGKVNQIVFSDITVNLNVGANSQTIPAADLQSIVELYIAYFNRLPDADGLNYWIDQFKAGQSINTIADNFYLAAQQYPTLTGYSSNLTLDQFITIVYANVLGRTGATAPNAAELEYWRNDILSGRQTHGTVVRSILVSAHLLKGDVTWGWVADLLDKKLALANFFAIQQGLNYNSPQESITKTMAMVNAITPTSTAGALALLGNVDWAFVEVAVTPTITAPGTGGGTTTTSQPGIPSECLTQPTVSHVGPFRTYPGDCIVSYKLTTNEFNALSNFDRGNEALSTPVYALQDKITNYVKGHFKDNFDTIFYIWDFEPKPTNAPYGFYSRKNSCAQTQCSKFLGTMTIPFWNDGIRNGPLLHEIFHQFGNYALPTTDAYHWGFSSVGGQLGGWNSSRFSSLGGNQYHAAATLPFYPGTSQSTIDSVSAQLNAFSEYTSGGNSVPYAPLELYSMGLIASSEVPDVLIAQSPAWIDRSKGNFLATGFTKYTAEEYGNLMVAAGEVKPDMAKARRSFRTLTIVLTDKDTLQKTTSDLITSSISQFTKPAFADEFWAKSGVNLIHNFWMATGGRATYQANHVTDFRRLERPNCQLNASAIVVPPGGVVQITADCAPAATGFLWSTGSTSQSLTVNPIVTTKYSFVGSNLYGASDAAVVTVQVEPGYITPPSGFTSQGGLLWTPISTQLLTYDGALSACTTTTFNGQTGWRLPTQLELSGVIGSGRLADSPNYAWTSSVVSGSSGHYILGLRKGDAYASGGPNTAAFICVR
ncbi:uncharacterized protein DUF4214 [Undibacterium pigrum]|uniref:Uncharacterized protein DUF4214 n=2 Tax=Undibacterium pigrum TaxID=401470 RepID=A0A318IJI4_9BURK|nr:uncharacterized protein DUF4214 [Undibacterium pigrum]